MAPSGCGLLRLIRKQGRFAAPGGRPRDNTNYWSRRHGCQVNAASTGESFMNRFIPGPPPVSSRGVPPPSRVIPRRVTDEGPAVENPNGRHPGKGRKRHPQSPVQHAYHPDCHDFPPLFPSADSSLAFRMTLGKRVIPRSASDEGSALPKDMGMNPKKAKAALSAPRNAAK